MYAIIAIIKLCKEICGNNAIGGDLGSGML